MSKSKKPTWRVLRPAILLYHGNISQIAEHFQVSRRTAYNWFKVDKTGKIKRTIKEAREGLLDIAEKSLSKKIQDGNLGAIIFYLKCQGKNRGYIEKQDHELSGEISISIEEHIVKSKEDLPDDK